MTELLAVGVDMGGTKTAFGVVTASGQVVEKVTVPTVKDSVGTALELVLGHIDRLTSSHRVVAVGWGVAGLVDSTGSAVVFAPHLPFRGEVLVEPVSEHTGLPVVLDNDANMATWAEWKLGAGRGVDDLVQVSFGTGIGGGLVTGGVLQRGHGGMAGEVGHQVLVPDGVECPCGNRGCWEQYASGRALGRAAAQAVAEGTEFGSRLLAASEGGAPDGRTVTKLARSGDFDALRETRRIGHWMGVGFANLAAVLDPELFVVGGGLVDDGNLFLGAAKETFAQLLPGRGHRVPAGVVPAGLGSDAALVGSAVRALETFAN